MGAVLKKSVKSKSIVPLRAENQDYRQVVPKVEVPVIVVNRKIKSKVKATVENFEQNQARECVGMQPAKSSAIIAAQSDFGIKKNPLKVASQAQSSFMRNKRSLENPAK